MIGKIKSFFTHIRLGLSIFFHSLFRGMKSADDKTMGVTKDGKITDNAIEEQIQEQGVLNDLLRGEVTQEVMELRDSNYRVFRHADDYQYLGNGNVVEKVKNMLQDDLKIYNPEGYKVLLIQDNKLIVKGFVESTETVDVEGDIVKEDKDERYTLKIEREVFPRFFIEKWVKKLVVREGNNNIKIDLYCSSYARQFNPTDSIFINEMMQIYGKKTRNFDTVDINRINFITNKAYGVKDLMEYHFDGLKYEGMNMYDKDFVITYSTECGYGVNDITDQFKTKEMDEKYATKARKNEALELSFEDIVNTQAQDTLDTNEALNLLKNLNISNFSNENSAE